MFHNHDVLIRSFMLSGEIIIYHVFTAARRLVVKLLMIFAAVLVLLQLEFYFGVRLPNASVAVFQSQ